MTSPGPPLDIPADVWAIVYAASRSADKATLRQVCSAARQGAFLASRSALVWDTRTSDGSSDPTGPEMLRLARRMPSLRSIFLVSHTRQAFLEAVDAVSAVAAERGMRLRGMGRTQDDCGDRYASCTSMAAMRWEAEEGGKRKLRSYRAFVELVDV